MNNAGTLNHLLPVSLLEEYHKQINASESYNRGSEEGPERGRRRSRGG
jgi:hypothetical protein